CGLAVAQRGGIMVNDSCQTSDPDIYAIGECASWNNRVYGLVAVGRIAREFNLYTKITGSQRIGLFGAQKDDLPEIWRQLIE
ncbi:FAD-dependent oxidoreductase, partial [Klebsiella pneumoniae]|uniref:FAD-dependent oxidoreductase n=1 Tax=Klebsiella pneumoniae TaxID=573 RepID=UPI0023814F1E